MQLLEKLKNLVPSGPVMNVTVEQIHNEIDALEVKHQQEHEKLLADLKIPTQSEFNRKAEKYQKLGIHQNEIVDQVKSTNNSIQQALNKQRSWNESLRLQNEYKLRYPNDKIVSMEDFQIVLKRYNLVFMPVGAYIKDIPEKNLDEMIAAKETCQTDVPEALYFITSVEFRSNTTDSEKKKLNRLFANNKKMIRLHRNQVSNSYDREQVFKAFLMKTLSDNDYRDLRNCVGSVNASAIEHNKFFIAAPASHFDANLLNEAERKYYTKSFGIKVKWVPKDPIGFKPLKGDFVRVISKWGTDDDQSFLDSIVQDERMN